MASSQVIIKEKTFEALPLVTGNFTSVILGTANKGEIEKVQPVGSLQTFRELYGTSSSRSFLNFAVKKYLAYSSNLYVARAATASAAQSSVEVVAQETSYPLMATITALTKGTDGDKVSVKFTRLLDVSGVDFALYTCYVLYDGDVVETYKNINFDSTDDNFIEDKINGISGYISIDVESGISGLTLCDEEASVSLELTGGNNGDIDNDGDLMTSFQNILEELKDKDKYEISLVIVPDYAYKADIISKLQELVNYRNDCMAIIDTPYGYGSLAPSVAISTAVSFSDGEENDSINLDNKNLALFAYWQQDYDNDDKVYKWIPPSVYVAAKVAEISANYQAWYPIAGVQYGKLNSVDVEFSPSQAQRDILYGEQLNGKVNIVNPIIKDPADGIMIWGQRTTNRDNLDPTNRFNVVMMLNFLKQKLYRIGKRLQFQPNNITLWERFSAEANDVCQFLSATNGVDDFKVICDSTTNTPSVIANQTMRAIVRVTPTQLAETIEITIETTPQNVSVT